MVRRVPRLGIYQSHGVVRSLNRRGGVLSGAAAFINNIENIINAFSFKKCLKIEEVY
jgi:hypothetical protein